ncbi:GT4 family glycosyltransferase PelF [Fusobacterium necrophorum]|uniref:Lipopolysaccharide N-acetylglucosaminyltransferase n=2 Tax=Fusobacterium necrophorum TaxID=859 RepID=A0AB73C6V9_9FUSO|nr:GT4 family glycosyltransferase PelF [Fusobacterium necrophorum]KDE73793.1 lipopolysaccharide N-acetylglucosaminyltransferase [Fusobacterium necrophorum DJ-2]MBR8821826.1 UDP-N-acetylglucosamine--peptide N-acetylglucosaminyltransferase GtfA subunit [Fusobacterium necrophorum]MCF0161882.1 GT4 family glycosyltransferase PelF [Fusobacterium necrophorum]
MKTICFICEGAYPYVVGGVSAWVHELIRSNPQHRFKVLCIIPNENFAKLKYQIPKNVIEIKNIIMDPYLNFSYTSVLRDSLYEDEEKKKSISEMLSFQINEGEGKLLEMEKVFSKNIGKPLEIILSKEYWNSLLEHYFNHYKKGKFSTYYWTYRNIILNLLTIGQEKIPEADIYHSVTTGYAGFVGALAAYRKQGKFLLTEHGIYPREREEEILGADWVDKAFKSIWIEYFYFLSQLTYQYCDKIVSLFEYNRNIQLQYGAPLEKTVVIPNGVDEEIYGNISFQKKDGFHIGAVLRVVPIKDIKMMIKGFRMVIDKMPDAKLWIIGPTDEDEEYFEECKDLVENLDMEKYITFTGRVDVREYYSFLDLLLLTSISEGQPLSILEGLSSGIPFIATDVGNCCEILQGKKEIGEAGLIIPPTSYIALGEALLKLYKNEKKLKEFSENGKKIVQKYYTKKYFIGQYRKLYEELGD